jgi:ribosomal protein S18 acetylase RimI-like enzyme
MALRIDLEVAADETAAAIREGLIGFNRRAVGRPDPQPFSLAVREGETIVGGINAIVQWDVIFIEHVWVSDGLRGRGLGRDLMARAEAEGVRLGAVKAILDTNDWQAPGFYAKLGYTPFGTYRYDAESKECILLVKPLEGPP